MSNEAQLVLAALRMFTYASCLLLLVYLGFVVLLLVPRLQNEIMYLSRIRLTRPHDLDRPEKFDYLQNQVTPFDITFAEKGSVYAWLILPLDRYCQHEHELLSEPSGRASDINDRLAFKILRNDPEARLIIHLHGAAGTVASGYRAESYRALSTGRHYGLAFDYRGFGFSPGVPSEHGIIRDALLVINWALITTGVPASRILISSQSMGTAVNIAVAEAFVQRRPSITFAGHLLIAPFTSVSDLIPTYRIAGIVPILQPLAFSPRLLRYLSSRIQDQWPSGSRLKNYVRMNEAGRSRYRITFIHSKDDNIVPSHHTSTLFRSVIDIMCEQSDFEAFGGDNFASGKTINGNVRKVLVDLGGHDRIMKELVTSREALRIFQEREDDSP